MSDSILKRIKTLPPLDDTIVMVQRICTDQNSSMQDLVKVVERDPMLTANILKSANSPLYGFSKEIKNVSHAISLFGMATIRGFALSSAIKQNFKIDLTPYGMNENRFLDISTTQSAFMFKWYSKVDRSMLDILQPASFMMEVGKLIIAHELIEKNQTEKFKNSLKECKNINELSSLERDTVGFSNEEITAKIFEQWNLENELIGAIRFSENPDIAEDYIRPYAKALQIVKQSINLFGSFTPDQIEVSKELIRKYNLSEENYTNTVEQFQS